MRFFLYIAFFVCAFFFVGCDTKTDAQPTGVIPKQQMDALQKANNVEGLMIEANQRRKESVQ
ncbi:hypothetical protein G8770_00630 [Aestuariicella hydrocarbonica]|uniref:Lipoprotein n=1 Tax=Pseudomaricurvus hydrocarbonicus TaxID=1470433 RepID=A0A9E5JSY2_9GAMM|nr:hypothetical protein [Aestuariicella hydrocarbonica]NHO64050.1 hypothetical protein [Aestuariicella hydrocarbonica]